MSGSAPARKASEAGVPNSYSCVCLVEAGAEADEEAARKDWDEVEVEVDEEEGRRWVMTRSARGMPRRCEIS